MRRDFATHMDDPEVVKTCLNCHYTDCIGICDDYKNAWRRSVGQCEMRRKKKPEVHPWDQLAAYGESHTLSEWARLRCISYYTLYKRVILNNWPMEKALIPHRRGGQM